MAPIAWDIDVYKLTRFQGLTKTWHLELSSIQILGNLGIAQNCKVKYLYSST